ncbi:hypothetical protein ACIQAA_27925 [Neobacillus sp. NPDC093182]|uniref:hypothetical protein n=1 Tax=Neobacillus sp. NPDC093182 TaxID=3364297 RepID=UPI0037F9FD59
MNTIGLLSKINYSKQEPLNLSPFMTFYDIVVPKDNDIRSQPLNQVTEVSESKPIRYVLETAEVMYYDWLHSES